MNRILAICNNDIVHIAWAFESEIPACEGFVLSRKPAGTEDKWVVLRSLMHFDNRPGAEAEKPTSVEPVKGFHWRDFLDAASRGKPLIYRIVAVTGSSGQFTEIPGTELITEPMTPTGKLAGDLEIYFNRGILSTQALARLLAPYGGTSPNALQKALEDQNGIARKRLSGELGQALLNLVQDCQSNGGEIYAALYELTDDLLEQNLGGLGGRLHVVLSNNTGDKKKPYDSANQPARDALRNAGCDLYSRFLPDSRSIGHNKFLIHVKGGKPLAVLTGSTNWTRSGLCTQSNNAVIVRSPGVAAQYLDYWKQLRDDTVAAGIPAQAQPVSALQGRDLRDGDAVRKPSFALLDRQTQVGVWYSPNTPTLIPRPRKGAPPAPPPAPPDMQDLFDMIDMAKQAVLVLCFQPGKAGSQTSATVVKYLAQVCRTKPWLFVRGVISDSEEALEFESMRTAEMNAEIVAPAGILKNQERWLREIYKAGHAIVHNKIVVIDPFSEDCKVITGSHNLGYKASYNNDENMLFIRGNPLAARGYAAHVADIYEHYRWRWYEQRAAQRAAAAAWVQEGADPTTAKKVDVRKYYRIDFDPSKPLPDWQARYFDNSRLAMREREFWTGAGQPLAALKPTSGSRREFGLTADEQTLKEVRSRKNEGDDAEDDQ